MPKTETLSITADAENRVEHVAVLGCFGWRLSGQQTEDSRRVRITLTRRLDLRYLDRIRELEAEYVSLAPLAERKRFPRPLWAWLPAVALGVGIPFWLHYEFYVRRPRRREAIESARRVDARRRELLREASLLSREFVSNERQVYRT